MIRQLIRRCSKPESSAFHRFVSSLIAGAAWLSTLLLLLTAYSPFVSPEIFPLAGVVGLAFPLALGGTCFALLCALLFAPRRSWIPLLGLLLSARAIAHYVPLHPTLPDDDPPAPLRIMTYNTLYLGSTAAGREDHLRYIDEQKPDIVCLQEIPLEKDIFDTFAQFAARSPYRYYALEQTEGMRQGIVSRYPITRTERLAASTSNAVWAHWLTLGDSLGAGGRQIIVLNCHLKSNTLSEAEREQFGEAVSPNASVDERSLLHAAVSMARKIGRASRIRAQMTDAVTRFIVRHAGTPIIVVGDFNDTPVSYPYQQMLSAGLKSAFAEAGTGIGRSFNQHGIFVRIDHGFVTPHFEVTSARIDSDVTLSDHYPLLFTLRWSKQQP